LTAATVATADTEAQSAADVAPAVSASSTAVPAGWAPEAERELNKIPFFVRGKARRNTERYAQERQLGQITIDTLYEAKAHFAR
jgi:light-independent protochlorophyllide reductase subunit B